MAIHLATLKTRSLSALIFTALFLFLFWFNAWTFALLFSIIHAGAWIEFNRLQIRITPAYKCSRVYYYSVLVFGWGCMLWATQDALHIGTVPISLIAYVLTIAALFISPIANVLFGSGGIRKRFLVSLVGVMYITLPCTLAMYVRFSTLTEDYTMLMLMSMVCALWLNDSLAYLVGSLIGRRKIAPTISPNKSLEGLVGGVVLTILIAFVVANYYFPTSRFPIVVTALITCVLGTLGDLFESKLKRRAGVKDSGNILPGHGGFLDRFDSMLFALPWVSIWIIVYA